MPGLSIYLIILYISQDFEDALRIKNATVLNMPQHSYNNIIIVINNPTISKFLSA